MQYLILKNRSEMAGKTMIDYQNKTNEMNLECDTCTIEQEYQGSYKNCITEAKQEGWIIAKRPSGFYHYCSIECSKNDDKKHVNNNR